MEKLYRIERHLFDRKHGDKLREIILNEGLTKEEADVILPKYSNDHFYGRDVNYDNVIVEEK